MSRLMRSIVAVSRMILVLALVVIIVVAGGVTFYFYSSLTKAPRGTLTLATFGGNNLMAWENIVNASHFQENYNVNVKYYMESTTLATLAKIQADPNNPIADIWQVSPQPAQVAIKAGVVEPLDISQITAIQTGDVSKDNLLMANGIAYGIANQREFLAIVVNTKLVNPADITSWKWLWSPTLKDKLGLWDVSAWAGFTVLQTAKIWGGDENHTDIAFTMLKQLAPNIHVLITTGMQSNQLIASGEVTAELGVTTVLWALCANQPTCNVAAIAPPDAPAFFTTDQLVLPKNSKLPLATRMAFINMFLTPEMQNRISCTEGESPVNVKANPKAYCPTNGALLDAMTFSSGWVPNSSVVLAQYDNWATRWATEIVPLIGKP